MTGVSRAVILAAGLGTRMLPATKAIPKEMLPIVDRPVIQYAVDEVVAAGIDHIIIVISEGKEAIREYYEPNGRTVAKLRAAGNRKLADELDALSSMARFDFAIQSTPRGIADAVASARRYVVGNPFVLVFPDDLLIARRSVTAQLVDVYDECQGTVIAVHEVDEADIPQYGIVDPDGEGNPVRLRGLVEKPPVEAAPSRLGIVGRYILSPSIFDHIERTPPGRNNEIQITDAIMSQIRAGEYVCAYQYEGTRYDTGRPLGYVVANVGAALAREDMAEPLRARLARELGLRGT